MLIINSNLLHLLDRQKTFLVGNGGFSYVLNNTNPTTSASFQTPVKQKAPEVVMAYEGRTPCNGLNTVNGRTRSNECYKLKWYVIFFTDGATGKPSHYLAGGTQYRTETMHKGNWEIITHKDGRVFYKLDPEKQRQGVLLLRASENILLFTDPDGNLLVGNEDFSYALNRALKREEPLRAKR